MSPGRVGRLIESKRVDRGWSPQRLAEVAEVSRAFVFRVEKGYGEDFSVAKLDRVARALGCTVDHLLRESESPEAARRQPALISRAA